MAGPSAALRPPARAPNLVRLVGIYIAGAAATIQMVDLFADRFHLPDRLFMMTVVIALVGLPMIVAAALLGRIAAQENAPPRPPHADVLRGPVPARAAAAPLPAAAPPALLAGSARRETRAASAVELALSHYRIAALHEAEGDGAAVRQHHDAFLIHARAAAEELATLIAEVEQSRAPS